MVTGVNIVSAALWLIPTLYHARVEQPIWCDNTYLPHYFARPC